MSDVDSANSGYIVLRREIRGLLEFYMGPNTSERRQYIMGHLV